MVSAVSTLTLDQRLRQVLQQLGIHRAHFGAGYAGDAVTLVRCLAESVASLTLVCPFQMPAEPLRSLGSRVLICHGDRGPGAATSRRLLAALPEAQDFPLDDYADAAWADAIADRGANIGPVWLSFLESWTQPARLEPVSLPAREGEIAGIRYRVQGSGPPLVLLPLSLARSQWDPLVPALAETYTTIVLGGAFLGIIPSLEERMRGGYQRVVQSVVEAADVRAGERVLEVGCGSGAVVRWLARFTGGANPITALDVNDYLLHEADALTTAAGLAETITFQKGDAEHLPLPSESIDVALSFTVMEEVDAERMLADMVRVTRPGGRIGIVVRATDMRPWINVPLRSDLMQAVESAAGVGVAELGCSDASLYRRFHEAGLRPLLVGPQLAPNR
ncbi:MAG TPA: methyltransferase domain-containing protein, partial [Chloroflexota bacterium]|nr:methyltransferase domain-containing protein [Chloroflexota bacterium]